MVRSLLAVRGDRLYAFGSRKVFCIDIDATLAAVADGPAAFDALDADGWLHWDSPFTLPERLRGAVTEAIRGRPVVTREHVIVPLHDGLAAIDDATGNRDGDRLGDAATYAQLRPSTDRRRDAQPLQGGNIVLLDDRLLVAGPSLLGVFADREAIRRRLLADAEADPQDPTPLVGLAELAYAEGETADALDQFRRAAKLPGGSEMVLDATLGVVHHEAAQTRSTQLLQLAEELAGTPSQHVRVRFALAAFEEAPGGPDERIAALQDVLRRPDWRDVAIDAGGGGHRPAGDAAREQIAALLLRYGKTLYDAYEDQAARELAKADDLVSLRGVFDTFPNSVAGRTALSQVATQTPDPTQRAAELRELRRAALAARDIELAMQASLRGAAAELLADRLEDAAAILRREAEQTPTVLLTAPLVAPDGRVLVPAGATIEQAAYELTRQHEQAARDAAPDANLPLELNARPFRPQPVAAVDAVVSIVPTTEPQDQVVVRLADGSLAIYAFGERKASLVTPPLIDLEPAAATLVDGDLITWGRGGISRHMSDGSTSWTVAASDVTMPPAGVSVQLAVLPEQEPEDEKPATPSRNSAAGRGALGSPADVSPHVVAAARSANGTVLAIQQPAGQLLARIDDDGTLAWTLPLGQSRVDGLTASAQTVVASTYAGSRGRLLAIDSISGQALAARGFDGDQTPLRTYAALPGGAVAFVSDGVRFFDPHAPHESLAGGTLAVGPQEADFTPALQDGVFAAAGQEWLGRPDAGRLAIASRWLVVVAAPRATGVAAAVVVDTATGEAMRVQAETEDRRELVLLTAAGPDADTLEPNDLPPRLGQDLQRHQQRSQSGESSRLRRTTLYAEASRVYLVSPRGLVAYDLRAPGGDVGPHWWRDNGPVSRSLDPANNVDLLLSRGFALLVDRPQPVGTRSGRTSTTDLRITPFGRQLVPDAGYETGLLRHEARLTAGQFGMPTGGVAVELMPGGLAILDRSGRLSFLAGAGEPTTRPATP